MHTNNHIHPSGTISSQGRSLTFLHSKRHHLRSSKAIFWRLALSEVRSDCWIILSPPNTWRHRWLIKYEHIKFSGLQLSTQFHEFYNIWTAHIQWVRSYTLIHTHRLRISGILHTSWIVWLTLQLWWHLAYTSSHGPRSSDRGAAVRRLKLLSRSIGQQCW